jgi:hypothetical protein
MRTRTLAGRRFRGPIVVLATAGLALGTMPFAVGTAGAAEVPAVTVGDTSIFEGDLRQRTARIMVTLDQEAPAGGVTVTWHTVGGSATSGTDFKARSGRLYFKYRQTTRFATIPVKADTAVEGDEQFTVVISSIVGGTIGDGTGVVTILSEDGGSYAALSIGSASVVEGNTGESRYVLLPVTLRGPAGAPVTVSYSTGGGSAVAPDDYLGRFGSVTFTAKATKRQVLIYLTADEVADGNKTFQVTLSSPVGATIANGTATVTLVDDD